jgi:hypothetical protein
LTLFRLGLHYNVHYICVFTFHEHLYLMNTEEEIVNKALEAFYQNTQVKAVWKKHVNDDHDGVIDFYFDKLRPQRYNVEIKKEIRNQNLPKLFQVKHQGAPLLVVAENILPNTKEELQKHNIGYLETNGNAHLKQFPNYFIWINNKIPKVFAKEVNRAFTKTGLKVVFLLLADETFVHKTYRTIAEEAEVGLGNVNNIIKGLKDLRLVILKNDKALLIPNKKAILDKWMTAYEQRLKPALHAGNFRFLDNNAFFNWRNVKLHPQTLWGGEPAGDLYTDNLNPGILTLYTTETRGELMKNYRLVPDEKGNIEVYKKFWKIKGNAIEHAVPPILAYTDLINTGNQRCIETAQKLYEKHIENKLR